MPQDGYQVEDEPAKPKSKKGVVIGAIAAAVVAAAAIFFFTRGGESGQESVDTKTLTEQELAEVKNRIIDDVEPKSEVDPTSGIEVKSAGLLIQEAQAELVSSNVEEAKKAINKLEKVAEKNYKSSALAMYILSTLYARNVNLDAQVTKNLDAMSWTKDNKKAHQLNEQAVKVNPECYQSFYELGCDYFAGEARGAVARDIDKALDLFKTGLVYAREAKDQEFTADIEKRIAELQ